MCVLSFFQFTYFLKVSKPFQLVTSFVELVSFFSDGATGFSTGFDFLETRLAKVLQINNYRH